MSRTANIAEALPASSPKLVVINSSTSEGRYQQMFRIRPTLLARARNLTVGPMYLILEHALEKLMDELEQLPPGTLRSLNAFEMHPSHADREMLDNVPQRRIKRAPRKVALDAGDDSKSIGDAGVKRKSNPAKN